MLQFLGLLPAKSEFRWVALEGSSVEDLRVRSSKKVVIPDFGNRERELAWVHTSVVESFGPAGIESACVVQGALAKSNTDAVLHRAQVEGVVLAALGALKMNVVSLKKGAMVGEFGLKRGASLINIPRLQALREESGMPKHFDEALSAALVASRHLPVA